MPKPTVCIRRTFQERTGTQQLAEVVLGISAVRDAFRCTVSGMLNDHNAMTRFVSEERTNAGVLKP